MSKKKNKLKWESYDLDLMIAVSRCVESPLELREILINLFHYEKHIICYTWFIRSLRRLLAAGIIYIEEGKYIVKSDLVTELKKYNIPPTDERIRIWDILSDLDKKYPLTKDLLEGFPRRLLTVFEFEEGITKLYDYINTYEPMNIIPRSNDGDGLFIESYSQDPTYGYSEDNPINVGGFNLVGSHCISLYLSSLSGYDNNDITHQRITIRKQIETPNGKNDIGFIDEFAVWYKDELEPQFLYFNTYDCELPLKAPMGFIIKEPFYLE